MTIFDCQLHWWPREYFDLLSKRASLPRLRADGDDYIMQYSNGSEVRYLSRYVDIDLQFHEIEATGEDIVMINSIGGDAFHFGTMSSGEAKLCTTLINKKRSEAGHAHPGRFVGIAVIPWEHPELACDILEDAVIGHGLKGVTLPSNFNGEPVDASRFRIIFKKIHELDVPILIHPCRSLAADKLPEYGGAIEFALGYLADSSTAAIRLVFSGLMEEFPNLKILHHHAGGVIPYIIGRIDAEVDDPWSDLPKLPHLPSVYFKRMYVDTVTLDPRTIRQAVEFYGIDHVVFGSDYPFWKLEDSLKVVREALQEPELSAVFDRNARTLFKIDS